MHKPTSSRDLPEFIFQRLETERERLWQVRGIVDAARKVIDHAGDRIEDTDQPLWWALSAASNLIEDINDRLDPAVISRQEENRNE